MAVSISMSITQNSQSIANNTSNVTVAVKAIWTYGSWNATGQCYGSITIDGTKYSFSGIKFNTGATTSGSQTIMTKTVNASHNTDGSKTLSCSASFNTGVSSGTVTASASKTLTTIPRATTMDSLSCATSYFDGEMTYKYTPQSASFYNKRTVYLNVNNSFTTLRTTELGKKSASQQSGTITLSDDELVKIYKALPSATSAKIRVTIRTYSDSGYSTSIGSASYKEVTLTIPAAIKPTASLNLSAINNNSWIKSLGVYVQNYSGLSATLSATAGTGASISSYSISGGDYSSSKNTLSVSKFTTAGSIKFTSEATDSRGRSASASKTITILPYSNPAIASLKVERGTYDDGEWTADENGADVKVTFKATLTLVDQDNVYGATFKIDGVTKTPDYGTTAGLASGASRAVYFFDVDSENSHTLTLTVKDEVGNTKSATITIPTINVTIEFNQSGNGIAFGKTSEDDAFECAWPAYFIKGIYANGLRIPEIQHGIASITPTAANKPTALEITFGKEFSDTPIVVATPVTSAPGTIVLGCGVYNRSKAGFTLYLTRSNTTETKITWIAMY